MKKYILLLAIFFALATRAWAADVVVAANEVPNFNPSGIGSDVTVTVAVNTGSPTITSPGQFRANWIGLGGFQVTIAGVRYTVANVASASSATLTTNYAGSSSASTPATWHKYCELRLYVDRPFRPLGKDYVVQSGTPGSGAWHKRVAASVINVAGVNTLFIPQLTIDATTDSTTDNTARYSAGFYTPGGGLIQEYDCFRSFGLPPATPTNWADVCVYNNSPVIARNAAAYTQDQVNAMLPTCPANRLIYYATTGRAQSCLTLGTGLSITGGVLNASGGPGGSIGGTIASGQVAFGVNTDTIGGEPDLAYNTSLNQLTVSGSAAAVTVTDGGTPASFSQLAGGTVNAQVTSATLAPGIGLTRVRGSSDYPDSGDELGSFAIGSGNGSNTIEPFRLRITATQNHSASLGGSGFTIEVAPNGSISKTTRALVSGTGVFAVQPGSRTVTSAYGANTIAMIGEVNTPDSNASIQLSNAAALNRKTLVVQYTTGQTEAVLELQNSSAQALQNFVLNSNQIEHRYFEAPANGGSYVSLRAPASLAANVPLTLLTSLPASGTECLTVSDTGVIGRQTCGAAGGSIGGTIAATQVAVGSGPNTIAGDPALTFSGANLNVSGATAALNVIDGAAFGSVAGLIPGSLGVGSVSASAAAPSKLQLARSRAAADYPDSGDDLAQIETYSYDQSNTTFTSRISVTATQNHSSSLGGSGWTLAVTPNGSSTPTSRILVGQTGVVAIAPQSATITTSFDSGALVAFGGLLQQMVLTSNRLETRFREDPANGTNYVALRAAASIGSDIGITLFSTLPGGTECVQLSSTGVLSTTGSTCGAGGGSGYATIQEEGSNLTQRTTLNFIGGGFTAADDAGNSRTNVTLDATLNSLAAFNTNGLIAQTAADTFAGRTITAGAGVSVTNGDGVSGNPTVTWAPDAQVNNFTLWNSASASRTLTIGLSGSTDPVFSFSDGVINVSTGALQVGGVSVITGSIASTQVPVASGTNAISGSANLTYASNVFTVGNAGSLLVTDGASPASFGQVTAGILNAQVTSASLFPGVGLTRIRASSDYPDSGDTLGSFAIASSNGSVTIEPFSMTVTATQNHSASLGGSGMVIALAANGGISKTNVILVNQASVVAIGPQSETITSTFDSNAVAAFGGKLQQMVLNSNRLETRFREDPANGTNYVALRAAASIGTDFAITLPAAAPVSTQCLQMDSGGTVTTTGSACGGGGGTPGGSSGNIQWNNGGVLAGVSGSSVDSNGIATLSPATSATTTITDTVINNLNSSGTPGNGYGQGYLFKLESSTTVDRNAARVQTSWIDAGDSDRTAEYSVWLTQSAGALRDVFSARPREDSNLGVDYVFGPIQSPLTTGAINYDLYSGFVSGSNIAGSALTLVGGLSTGTGVPGHPSIRYALQSNSSGTSTNFGDAFAYRIPTTLFTKTNTTTVASSTSLTDVSGTIFPASGSLMSGGLFQVGRTVTVEMSGTFAIASSSTLQIGVRLDDGASPTTVASVTRGAVGTIGTTGFSCTFTFTGRTFGSSGTGFAQGHCLIGAATAEILTTTSSATFTEDFTVDQTVVPFIQWGVNNAGNTISVTNIVARVDN